MVVHIYIMTIQQNICNVLKIIIAAVGLFSIFFTVIDLMYFLSDPHNNIKNISSSNDIYLSVSWSLLNNTFLLSLFMIQHSVLALPKIKERLIKYGLQDLYRVFYTITVAIILQVLIKNWLSIPQVTFWKFSLNYTPFRWLYTLTHVVAWTVIYVGNICKDVTELLGIKQVYYSAINLPDPNSHKSRQLQRLNDHMRHPSFLAFLLIFWIYPVMSLDRVLLAMIFSSYMYIAWNTDDMDYAYQQDQYKRKFYELEKLG